MKRGKQINNRITKVLKLLNVLELKAPKVDFLSDALYVNNHRFLSCYL